MVAIHSRGDAGGRQIEMRGAGGCLGADEGSSRDGSSLPTRVLCRPKQSDLFGYILNLTVDYGTWLC
jgi:hypothetical protein